ncbi:hypothetical protein V5O48_013066 [Marasmius crinis-equi]|uniref:Uncharacterized protein n=1 Tax=Marasmius crinis-equi TaxID=585013 RepID=A0ABR3F155_9AGAR
MESVFLGVRYPLAHAAGYRGTKADMRKDLYADIRRELQERSPKPPRLRCFKPHHMGHPVTPPILRTSEPEKAGSWIQMCWGTHSEVECNRPFVLVPPLGVEHALHSPFPCLCAIQKELEQVARVSQPVNRNEERLSSPPSSPVPFNFTSSPSTRRFSSPPTSLPPSSSPPSSPVLRNPNMDAQDAQEEETLADATVSVKFWVKDVPAGPVNIDLETENGKLFLGNHKVALGELYVEKSPMDVYNAGKGIWEPFTWAGGIDVGHRKELLIRERGLSIVIG